MGISHRKALALVIVLLATVLVLLATPPGIARAHPQGDTSVNRYVRIELYEGVVHLHYVLDYAEIPTLFWEFNNNVESDGRIPLEAKRATLAGFEDAIAPGLVLAFDGQLLELRSLDSSLELFDGDMGLRVLRVVIAFEVPVSPSTAQGEFRFEDRNDPGRAGWRAITVQPGQASVANLDPTLLEDPSQALTRFPDEWLLFPPIVRSATFDWDPATGDPPPHRVELDTWKESAPGRWASVLSGNGPWWLLVFGLALAFSFGVLDALGPGHGKTVVSSYLAGSGAGSREALAVGVVAATTHTVIILSLALLAISVAPSIASGSGAAYFGAVAGAVLLAVGAILVWQHRRGTSPHSHRAARRTGLLGVGIAGGLVPCPAALLILLATIVRGDLFFGIALIGAFGLGMGVVLVGVGLMVVNAGRIWRHERLSALRATRAGAGLEAVIPIGGGLVVTFAGALMLASALVGATWWSP
jgi:nickel/cobalt transporter (NicO) family protein